MLGERYRNKVLSRLTQEERELILYPDWEFGDRIDPDTGEVLSRWMKMRSYPAFISLMFECQMFVKRCDEAWPTPVQIPEYLRYRYDTSRAYLYRFSLK